MQQDYLLKLTFWGVRGSTPTPRIENLNYGGNTSCLEVCTGEGEVLIFDAGTGITPLGWHLVENADGPVAWLGSAQKNLLSRIQKFFGL